MRYISNVCSLTDIYSYYAILQNDSSSSDSSGVSIPSSKRPKKLVAECKIMTAIADSHFPLHLLQANDTPSSPSSAAQSSTPPASSDSSSATHSDHNSGTESPLPKPENEYWKLSKEMHEINLEAEITRFIPTVQEAICGKVRI